MHDATQPEVSPRFARQVSLPGFGPAAQSLLGAARVLVIGAGGLGSSVLPALAAAGVGTIGIIDDDRVELSNLHRQLIHGVLDVGQPKVISAAASIAALSPSTTVNVHETRVTASNALTLFGEYDLVLDGSDNFATRYLANDAAAIVGIPLVWGAVSQYSGQAGVAWASRGPHYRDLFPVPPAPGSVLSCAVGGVLPTVCGVIGSIMTTEAIKIITGIGEPLIGRVTLFDALSGSFRSLSYAADPAAAPITELIDYEVFCGVSSSVSPASLEAELQSGASLTLLDVREPWEASLVSLPGSVLVPLAQLAEFTPAGPVVVYCHHGTRSAAALAALETRGVQGVRQLAGGIDAWARDVDSSMVRY